MIELTLMKQVHQKSVMFVTREKVDGNMIFTDYWKFLVLNFLRMKNTVCFWAKTVMKRRYLLITEKFFVWTFRWWEMRSFFSQKVDGKMIFTWSFWPFYDIPGLEKYGFLRSDFFLYKYYWSILWWSFCNFLVILSTIKFSVVFEFFKLL